MKTIKKILSKKFVLFYGLLLNLSHCLAGLPHLKGMEKIQTGETDGIVYMAMIAKAGGLILIIIGSVVLIYQGMNSMACALRSLRTEEGNISNLTMHTVGAIVSITFGLFLGYFGYEILTSFNPEEMGL